SGTNDAAAAVIELKQRHPAAPAPASLSSVATPWAFWLEVRHLERAEMELSDGLLLQVNNGEQGGNRWKHSNEDSDRSCSPSVLRCVSTTWKEGLLNRKRPFVGLCCHSCTPQSQERLFNPSIPSLGLRNVIYINETHTRYRGWLARSLSYVLFVLERDVNKDMFTRNVVDNVLNNSRVEHAIMEVATEADAGVELQPALQQKAVGQVRRKARGFLQEMVANVSPTIIRLTGWSHIDYLLITFILFCHNIKAPHIAAGNNLNIPIFRSLLHAYTEELLRQQQFLEVYLEGTRSRSGKPSPARAGMLSIVVDTLCTGAIPDVLVVPVGISYDRILEGNYNSEQLGKPKKNESLWGVACGVLRMLRKNYGCVRVDFTQPFSLKEYLDSQSSRNVPPPPSLEHTLVPIIISAQPDGAPFQNPQGEEPNGDLPDELCRRHVISNLAKHGVVLSKLVEDFFNMKEEILSRDFDLGFSGNSEDVVMHALHLLGNCVNVTSSSNRNGEFTVAPSNTVPALFELNFYSNGLVLALQRELAAESQSSQQSGGGVTASCALLSQERLIRKAAGLAHFLTNEVAVAPPCQTVYQVFHDAVARLIQYGVLYVAEEDQEELSPSPTEEAWPKKFPEPLSWRSDEEDEDSDFGEEQRDRYLKVSTSSEHQDFFVFLQRLLSPVLEAYSGAAILVHSLKQPVDEREYTQQLFRYLLTRTERGVAAYGESATHYLVKNTVKTFKELGVLKERRENRVTTLELSTTFLPQAHRSKLLHYILAFILL
ncbi:hypothetical protein CRUP_003454, partial [Coryphaenoides rupestris]